MPSSLPFETLLHHSQGVPSNGQFAESTYVELQTVLQTQSDAEAFRLRYPRTLPAIDFTTRTAIVTLLFLEPTFVTEVEMTRIADHPDRLVVHSVRWLTPPHMAVPLAVGHPIHVVTIPKTTKAVAFAPLVSAYTDMRPAERSPVPRTTPSPL